MQIQTELNTNTTFFIPPLFDKKSRKNHSHRQKISLDEYLGILKKMDKQQLTMEVNSERFDRIMKDDGNKEGRIMRYYVEVYQPLFLN